MGIDITSKFLVGLHYEDFTDEMLEEIDDLYDGSVSEWAEDKELDSASPYYDAGSYECFYGYDVSIGLDVSDTRDVLLALEKQFKENFKTDPVVYAGCHVW